MKHQLHLGACLLALVATVAPPVLAQEWDLAADWSDTANPNGDWSYRIDNAIVLSGIRGGDSFATPPGAPVIWGGTSAGTADFIGWSRANGSEAINSWDLPLGTVYGHTIGGDSTLDIDWTSPLAGTVQLSIGSWMIRDIGRSASWTVYLNDTPLYSGALYSGDDYSSSNPESYTTPLTINSSDVVRFSAQSGTPGDYVAVAMHVTAIPEPATYAALFGISGLAAVALRRYRRKA